MNPFTAWKLPSPDPAAKRTLELFGGTVELWLLPERARRHEQAPALLRADRARKILAEETVWAAEDGTATATPNRYPFARSAAILWTTRIAREPDDGLLALAFALAEPHEGTALLNTLGAAATQPRAHVHLAGERLPFLGALPTKKVAAKALGDGDWPEVEVVRLAPPFPGCVLGVRGELVARARTAARLLALRVTPAANLISDGSTTWFVPRRCETPEPHFPAPLGCAEVWGRFCYEDEAAFARADAAALQQALALALWPGP